MSNLRDQIEAIRASHGRLTPELVVDEARNPDHPLHHRFDWDDVVAGEKWRRVQAGELIRSVRVIYRNAKGEEQHTREYHSVRRGTGYVYESTDDIVQDEMLTKIVLADMKREWHQLRAKYERFAEFAEMVRGDVAAA